MSRMYHLWACVMLLCGGQQALGARVLAADAKDLISNTDQRRPIIGILSQSMIPVKNDSSYFAASYAKYAAMGGAEDRARPV